MLNFSILIKTIELLIKAVLIFIITLWGLNVSAKEVPVKSGRMKLSFQAEETFIPKAFRERLGEDWKGFCADFGNNFLVGKGPQGRGIYTKVDCDPIQFVRDADVIPVTDDPWRFVFTWKDDAFGLSVYYQAKGSKKDRLLVTQMVFPKQLTPDFLFGTPESKYYVINRVYRKLPFAWSATFKPTDIQWQLAPLQPQMLSVLVPPRKLGLYSMSYNPESKTWTPVLYAVAQLVVADDSSRNFDRDGSGPMDLRWIQTPRQPKFRLWAQEITNPLEKDADPSFLTMREGKPNSSILEGYALEGLKSNTFTLRYGTPFPKGSTVVSRASKIEFTANFGKGALDGLTFGIENAPRLESHESGETYSYSWTRTEIGWSFILGTPQTIDRFATRFHLTPKIGLLSVNAYFPLNASENLEFATVAEFKLSHQIDMGGEFSWELESLSYRLKVWATTHLSGYLLAPSNPTKISNQRAGADFSYEAWKSKSGYRLGLIGFGYIDWVTLQKQATPQLSLLTTSTTASGASYNVTYLGLGLSLTW
ncbi:MAG: hypothetical protein H7249_07955 [Chitinophagaceae bacterium]|nr:hypothetical protein [Oligoflexus sp.]